MDVFTTALVMGFAPMLTYVIVLWWLDHWEREPWPMVAGAFLWGAVPAVILTIISSRFAQQFLSARFVYSPDDWQTIDYVLIAPVCEELTKGLALLLLFLFLRREIDSMLDGILYGAVVGFGFAAVENVVYFTAFGKEGPVPLSTLILLRAAVFGLNHAFFTGLTGLGFALARYQRFGLERFLFPFVGLSLAMTFHGLHNFLVGLGPAGAVLSIAGNWFGIFWVLVIIVLSLGRQGRWMKQYLAEEIEIGTLTTDQAAAACSFSHRLAYGFGLLGFSGFGGRNTRHFDQLCAKLAIKKHQLHSMGDERGNREAVDRLRRKLMEMGGGKA